MLQMKHQNPTHPFVNLRFAAPVLAFALCCGNAHAQPYSGTIFIDPDIITDADPSTLASVTYTGQGMVTVYDRRPPGWVTINAYLFDVVWNDGLTSVAMVNPEFGSETAAAVEAETYAYAIGKMPTCLREDVNEIWIHQGVYPFGGGNNSILIHTGQSALYIADGILEETLVHESSHTSLDATHAASSGWLAAQAADPNFISTYAEANPTTEDIAESYLTWLAVRYRASRISQQNYDLITQNIPNRLAYFDAMPCDLFPITSGVGVEEEEVVVTGLYPSPTTDWITVRTNKPLPANARFELTATDGRVVHSTTLAGRTRVDVSDVAPGIYLWRCHTAGKPMGAGTIAVE